MKFLLITILLLATNVNANTAVKLFDGGAVVLPNVCHFILRGGLENSFSCPTEDDKFRSVSFPSPAATKEFESAKSTDELNRTAVENNMDIQMLRIETAKIENKIHYLRHYQQFGQKQYMYTVCDRKSCISISASSTEFITNLLQQFSSKTIYDF